MGGVPVFAGTRVPATSLTECLTGGYTLDEFLESFQRVSVMVTGLLRVIEAARRSSASSP